MKNVLRGTFIPGRFSAPKMNRDPHAGRFGAGVHDAVSDMGGDQKPVARSQRALVAIVPEQARFSLQQRHPFVAVLVVPLALGVACPTETMRSTRQPRPAASSSKSSPPSDAQRRDRSKRRPRFTSMIPRRGRCRRHAPISRRSVSTPARGSRAEAAPKKPDRYSGTGPLSSSSTPPSAHKVENLPHYITAAATLPPLPRAEKALSRANGESAFLPAAHTRFR